jgi:hypothetical protein
MSGVELLIGSIASGIGQAATAAGTAVGSAASAVGSAAGTVGTALASPTVQALGTAATVGGTILEGVAAKEAAKVEAKNLKTAASDERASSQREAELDRRRTHMILSEQRAKGAASGAGTGGTLLDLMASTAAEGDIKGQSVYYQGNARAQGLKDKAAATGYRARADYAGTILDAASQGAEGAYKFKQRRGYA